MSENIPTSTHSGRMTLLGVEVELHVLDNGQRVFEAEGFKRLLDALFSGSHSEEDLAAVARTVKGVQL